jgi:hypothetical protein
MKLIFNTDENDYLQYDLFINSKSEEQNKTRRRMWIGQSLMMALLGGLFFVIHERFFGWVFVTFFIVILFFYPAYVGWRFKERIKRSVKSWYGIRPDKELTIIFDDENIEALSSDGASKYPISELEKIDETGQYFFINLKSGSLFVPKTKITNIDEVRTFLKALTLKSNASYNAELDWKWR